MPAVANVPAWNTSSVDRKRPGKKRAKDYLTETELGLFFAYNMLIWKKLVNTNRIIIYLFYYTGGEFYAEDYGYVK